jgi:hypothetical protein
MGTEGSFPGESVKLTTHLQLVPRSRKCGSTCPLPIRVHGVVVNYLSTGTTLPYPGICMKTGKENKNSLNQDSRCSVRDSNRASPEYKSRALPLNQPVRYLFINNSFNNAVISSVYSVGSCILLCLLQRKTFTIPWTILAFSFIHIWKRNHVAC